MGKPILYLMVGYPGAGKTTTAKLIADRTGAMHIWADEERHKMFGEPTHSEKESIQLYEYLNHRVAELLMNGESVVFDTNFNFRADRDKLRDLANQRDAQTVVVWVNTPTKIARKRAVTPPVMRNGYMVHMTDAEFDAIVAKLEKPDPKHEKVVKINGTKLDQTEAVRLLSI